MATIIEFRRAVEPRMPREASADDRSCEVIIFPGVRIERYADNSPGGTAMTSRKRASRGRKRQRR